MNLDWYRVRIAQLENAIREVVSQQADDLCWLDVYQKLASLVGVKFDPLLLPRERFLVNCSNFYESLQTHTPYKPDDLSEAMKRIAELESVFDLRWKADMRAIKRWQQAHPGQELTWPDHADLVVFLLERLEVLEASKHGGG